MADLFAPADTQAIQTYICTKETAAATLGQLSDVQRNAADFHGFDGGLGQSLIVFEDDQPIALLGARQCRNTQAGAFCLGGCGIKIA